jgi:hypothetical protein
MSSEPEHALPVPFVGLAAVVEPWLTVAWGARLDEAEEAGSAALPLHERACEAVFLRQEAPERWGPVARFPFRGV